MSFVGKDGVGLQIRFDMEGFAAVQLEGGCQLFDQGSQGDGLFHHLHLLLFQFGLCQYVLGQLQQAFALVVYQVEILFFGLGLVVLLAAAQRDSAHPYGAERILHAVYHGVGEIPPDLCDPVLCPDDLDLFNDTSQDQQGNDQTGDDQEGESGKHQVKRIGQAEL